MYPEGEKEREREKAKEGVYPPEKIGGINDTKKGKREKKTREGRDGN